MTSERQGRTPSDLVGERVRQLRKRRGWTAAQLAERCAAAGASEITTAAISNIETGRRDKTGRRRREVTIEEVLVLAYVLRVPPVLLFAPLGTSETVNITPTFGVPAWYAVRWVEGSEPPVERGDDGALYAVDLPEWREASVPLPLYREAAATLRELRRAAAAGAEDRRAGALESLARVLNIMIEASITPPHIPRELLDEMRGRGLLRYPDDVPVSPFPLVEEVGERG